MPFFSTVAKVRRDDTGALTDIPVLISEEGPLTPLIHYLLWRSHDRSLSWMRKVTLAVQRFLLYMEANSQSLGSPEAILNSFIQRLYSGTIGPDGLDPSGLYWRPMGAKTAAPLLACLSDFSDWLAERQSTNINPLRQASRFDEMLTLTAMQHRHSRAFLGHTYSAKQAASLAKKSRSTRAKKTPHVADEGEVKEFPEKHFSDLLLQGFIKRGFENHADPFARLNLRDCLITLLVHGAGFRLSECFHLWVHDVTPDPLDPSMALVHIHHPAEGAAPSDWFNERGKPVKGNRSAYLVSRYGLRPRNQVAGLKHAGWKDPALDEDYYMRAYWFYPVFGRIFLQLWNRYLIQLAGVKRQHPFAFVVFKGATAGEMYSITAYCQAHRQAVQRIGLEAAKMLGTTPHGHRHAYGQRLRRNGIEPCFRQKALHHKAPESQGIYTAPSSDEVSAILNQAAKSLEQLSSPSPSDSIDLERLLTFGFEDVDPSGLFSGPNPKLQRK